MSVCCVMVGLNRLIICSFSVHGPGNCGEPVWAGGVLSVVPLRRIRIG